MQFSEGNTFLIFKLHIFVSVNLIWVMVAITTNSLKHLNGKSFVNI